jgi:S1-C subfamily serine protease
MTPCACENFLPFSCRKILVAVALAVAAISSAQAQSSSLQELISGVVGVKTFINPDARTTENLGRTREGSGIVLDDSGLVLTIGYLMVEAHAAEVTTNDGRAMPASVVGYDHETGFGLLRAIAPLKVRPMAIGKAAEVKKSDPVLIASSGGAGMVAAAHVAAVREFAGSWEYLLDSAIFTSPPHSEWSGAALISREGKLVGVGSLIVSDAAGDGTNVAGNMFVPIDMLAPILADLQSAGRVPGPGRPWLGVSAEPSKGRLTVQRVTQGGPAEKAGLRKGDVIVGVAGEETSTLTDFYRRVWARGAAGAVIPLDVLQENQKRRLEVPSADRLDHLRLKSTY